MADSDTYARNSKFFTKEINREHFWKIFGAIEVALAELTDEDIVDFFDTIDQIWDDWLALVFEKKNGTRTFVI